MRRAGWLVVPLLVNDWAQVVSECSGEEKDVVEGLMEFIDGKTAEAAEQFGEPLIGP